MSMRRRIAIVLGLPGLPAPPIAARGQGREAPAASTPGGRKGEETPATAAGRLAEQLKRHPAEASALTWRRGVYLMDLARGGVTLIADEPDPGAESCGTPSWTRD